MFLDELGVASSEKLKKLQHGVMLESVGGTLLSAGVCVCVCVCVCVGVCLSLFTQTDNHMYLVISRWCRIMTPDGSLTLTLMSWLCHVTSRVVSQV